ncbi:hypothetical protein BS17DRAFT_72090 [Gyrodon lividus]|nr:hypothetical protein BS17DRAFT_72090 [Gyrodon lividus]
MMHRVLLVPEILLIIFNFITDDSGNLLHATLAAVVRTCRFFQPSAEEILWSELRSIKPFYPILPTEVRKKETQLWSSVNPSALGLKLVSVYGMCKPRSRPY